MADANDESAKLDRLRALIAHEKEVQSLLKLGKGNAYGAELTKITDGLLDTFFEFATKPLKNEAQFQIVLECTEYFMQEKPIEYTGTIEDAIDNVLQEVNDEAGTPLMTGLLAIIRYRIEGQRRQIASV